jgi:hypothetical protein
MNFGLTKVTKYTLSEHTRVDCKMARGLAVQNFGPGRRNLIGLENDEKARPT